MSSPEVHLNKTQQDYMLTLPNRAVGIIGRGGGKSFGLQSVFLAENAMAMPRGIQRFGAYSYLGLLGNILPGVIEGWREIYNWQEGVHFFVQSYAPKRFNWDKPYFQPRENEKYLIHFYNGHVILLASMDRTINNGASIDAFALDEARMARRRKVAEMIPAMRGNLDKFGHLSNYGSMLMTSDMPDLPHEMWLFEYEDEHTEHLIAQILAWQSMLHGDEGLLMRHMVATGEYKEKLRQEINRIHIRINNLRKECTAFIVGTSLDNLHALGRRTIERWKESMTDDEFSRSVLTKRRNRVKNGFYAALDPERDSYDGAFNYSLIDNMDGLHAGRVKRSASMDGDYFPSQPLYIAFDHNNAINCIVIGQLRDKHEGHIINAMYVLQPLHLDHLLDNFIEYYRHTPDDQKRIVYYYDQTSTKGNSQGTIREYEKVISKLTKAGWKVNAVYLGRTDDHNDKYKMWNNVLMRSDPTLIKVRYNRVNCLQMEVSMLGTNMRRVGDDYRKDKRTEDKDYKTDTYKVPPQDAPHMSEAADTLLRGWIENPKASMGFSNPVTP